MSTRPPSGTATRYAWTDIEADHPIAGIARRLLVGERVMVGRMEVEEGFHMEPHEHHNEQISIVLEGRLLFRVSDAGTDVDREVEVGAGEVMVLPPHVPHGATALEPSLVLDLFSPPNEKTGIDQD